MFSSFGHILNVKPRHAENADSRLDIRRHDPDRERRQPKEDEGDKKAAFGDYDNASVSVEALRVFLENFLKSHFRPDENEIPDSFQQNETAGPASAGNAQASRAASLYQSAAARNHVISNGGVAPTPSAESIAASSTLPTEDVKTILQLMNDLRVLQSRGVESLIIERGETFLASLAAAVEKAKVL